MIFQIFTRFWIGALFVALCWIGVNQLEQHAEQRGYERRELEYKAAEAAAEQAARATEARQSEAISGAIDARTKKTTIARADAVGVDFERERVRDAFTKRSGDLSEAASDSCASDSAAFAELLEAVGQAVDELARDAELIAEDADGHAADSLMYQQGWPK